MIAFILICTAAGMLLGVYSVVQGGRHAAPPLIRATGRLPMRPPAWPVTPAAKRDEPAAPSARH
jgi:hypothetical protein